MITTSGAGGTRARTLAGAAAVVAAAVAIASCGGTGKAAGTDAPTAPTSATADSTPAPSATSLQDRFVAVIGRVSPAVVEIRTDAGLGSGVVFDFFGSYTELPASYAVPVGVAVEAAGGFAAGARPPAAQGLQLAAD